MQNTLKKLKKLAQIFLSEPFRTYPEDTEYAKGYVQGVRDAGKRLIVEFNLEKNHNI